jgi:hypothetical protein
MLPLLMLLALSVTGCATTSLPVVPPSPTLPTPPLPLTPTPSVSYSSSAQKNIQSWRQKLMATPLTQQPSSTLGKP